MARARMRPGPGRRTDESDIGGRAMPTLVERARARIGVGGLAVFALAAAGVTVALITIFQRYGLADLALERAALRNWVEGLGLYAYRDPGTNLGAAMPPVAAFLLSPVAVLPLGLTGWLIALTGTAALVLAMVALVGPVARRYGRRRWPAVFAASALALTAEPVRATLGLGDLDLILFGLVTADIVALRRGAWARSRATWWPGRPASAPQRDRQPVHMLRRGWANGAWAGVGTGLAAAVAVGPALFIAYLAITRQWRAAITAMLTVSTLAAAALLCAPRETAAWFGEVLWRIDRTGGVDRVANQSLAGVLARMYDSATTPVLLWLSFALLLVAVGMIRARSAHSEGDEIAAFTLVGLTGAIVGPVSDTHELIWVLPATLILVDAAARQRTTPRRPLAGRGERYRGVGYAVAAALTYLLFVAAPVWTFFGNAYAFGLILLINALPWRSGVAPAFPINRWLKQGRRKQPIPPARRPMGS
jgi:alpha-1,2-mannosyltransferase